MWPSWWTDAAADSGSARAELTYTVARRLGMSPRALMDEETEFVWRDDAKFKRLSAAAPLEQQALVGWGSGVARIVLRATPEGLPVLETADSLRGAVLADARQVGLQEIVTVCWAVGVPVLSLAVLPLARKRMQAMSVRIGDRYVILIAQSSQYTSALCFTVAHELGHIMLGHMPSSGAVIDLGDDDDLAWQTGDAEEEAANRFGLRLLTGRERPRVSTASERYSARQLASAVVVAGSSERIEPGVLALCFGWETGRWDKAYGALKLIPPGAGQWASRLNQLARTQMRWSDLSAEDADYLDRILGPVQE